MNEPGPSQKSQVSHFFFSIVITHNVNKKRDTERKGSSFPSWESKVGEKENSFGFRTRYGDQRGQPRREREKERERDRGSLVLWLL